MLAQDRQHRQRHAGSEQHAASENKSSDHAEMQLQAERTAKLLRQRRAPHLRQEPDNSQRCTGRRRKNRLHLQQHLRKERPFLRAKAEQDRHLAPTRAQPHGQKQRRNERSSHYCDCTQQCHNQRQLRQRSSRLLIKRSRCGDLGTRAKKLLQLVSERIQPPGRVAES